MSRLGRLLAALLLLRCDSEPAEPAPSTSPSLSGTPVLLVSLDTLRADALGVYGFPGGATPHLDAFADAGLRFASVRAPSPWTLPSHATLFTGLDVAAHGVRGDHDLLSESIPTLAERFARAGYATAAFTDGGYMHQSFGLLRGFEHVNDEGGGLEVVAARATAWIEAQTEPWFAFVHAYDAHSAMHGALPYLAGAEDLQRFAPHVPLKLRGDTRLLDRINLGQVVLDADEREVLHALYQASVASADRAFGAFWDELMRRRLVDEALACVVSDHGEGFLEHGLVGHGHALYDEFVKVPWLMRGPGVTSGGVVDGEVHLQDVAATLWDAVAAVAEDEEITEAGALVGRGVSRWPSADGSATASRPGLVEMDGADAVWPRRMSALGFDWEFRSIVLFDEPWKLHWWPESGRHELYHLATDPEELHDVSAAHPDRVAGLVAEARTASERAPLAPPTRGVAMDALLEALGYSVLPDDGR